MQRETVINCCGGGDDDVEERCGLHKRLFSVNKTLALGGVKFALERVIGQRRILRVTDSTLVGIDQQQSLKNVNTARLFARILRRHSCIRYCEITADIEIPTEISKALSCMTWLTHITAAERFVHLFREINFVEMNIVSLVGKDMKVNSVKLTRNHPERRAPDVAVITSVYSPTMRHLGSLTQLNLVVNSADGLDPSHIAKIVSMNGRLQRFVLFTEGISPELVLSILIHVSKRPHPTLADMVVTVFEPASRDNHCNADPLDCQIATFVKNIFICGPKISRLNLIPHFASHNLDCTSINFHDPSRISYYDSTTTNGLHPSCGYDVSYLLGPLRNTNRALIHNVPAKPVPEFTKCLLAGSPLALLSAISIFDPNFKKTHTYDDDEDCVFQTTFDAVLDYLGSKHSRLRSLNLAPCVRCRGKDARNLKYASVLGTNHTVSCVQRFFLDEQSDCDALGVALRINKCLRTLCVVLLGATIDLTPIAEALRLSNKTLTSFSLLPTGLPTLPTTVGAACKRPPRDSIWNIYEYVTRNRDTTTSAC